MTTTMAAQTANALADSKESNSAMQDYCRHRDPDEECRHDNA